MLLSMAKLDVSPRVEKYGNSPYIYTSTKGPMFLQVILVGKLSRVAIELNNVQVAIDWICCNMIADILILEIWVVVMNSGVILSCQNNISLFL